MNRRLRSWSVPALAAGLIAMLARPAAADDSLKGKRMLIVPLSGEAAGVEPGMQARLSEAVRSAADTTGARTEMAQTSLDDLLMINGCTIEQKSCLRNVARTLGVDQLVVGEISAGGDGGGLSVRLVRVPAKGAATEKRFSLAEAGQDQMALEMSASATELFPGARAPEPLPPDQPTPPEPPADPLPQPLPQPPVDRSGFSLRRVEPYAWVVAGGGIGLLAIGGAFLQSASGTQDEIDRAPTDTFEEIEQLRALEAEARTRYIVGDLGVIVGTVATGVGIALIVHQARGRGTPEQDIALAPLIVPGGGGIAVTFTAP